MSHVNFGKCVNDIPIDKIYEGMRVGFRNPKSHENFVLGKVVWVRKDKFTSSSFNEETNQPYFFNKQNVICIDFDADVRININHNAGGSTNVFHVEETK